MITFIRRARRAFELSVLRGAPHVEMTLRSNTHVIAVLVIPSIGDGHLQSQLVEAWKRHPACAAVGEFAVSDKGLLSITFYKDDSYGLQLDYSEVITRRAQVLGFLARVALFLLPGGAT